MHNLPISLIQTSPHWEDIPSNLKLFEKKMEGLQSGQVVVLPEMFNTGFSMRAKALAETMEGQTASWMKEQAGKKGIVLTGSLIIEENGQYFNRLLWVLPNGEVAHYDKRHLFSYAKEDQFYSPGKSRLIAQVMGWRIGLFICYDLRFPVWLRQQKKEETQYDLLIVIANWPASRIEAWKTLLRARAIENQCFVAGVNRIGSDGQNIHYNGNSAFYNPLGEEIQKSEDKDTLLHQTLRKEEILSTRTTFPFLNDADAFHFNI